MSNRGWDSSGGGGGVSSTARQSGRTGGSGGGEEFIQGSKCADPGNHNDPLDSRGDLFEPPGQMSTC